MVFPIFTGAFSGWIAAAGVPQKPSAGGANQSSGPGGLKKVVGHGVLVWLFPARFRSDYSNSREIRVPRFGLSFCTLASFRDFAGATK